MYISRICESEYPSFTTDAQSKNSFYSDKNQISLGLGRISGSVIFIRPDFVMDIRHTELSGKVCGTSSLAGKMPDFKRNEFLRDFPI